jgi:hypothetical protein
VRIQFGRNSTPVTGSGFFNRGNIGLFYLKFIFSDQQIRYSL